MGAAKTVVLRNATGTAEGFLLEIRKATDGNVLLRLFQPGSRAGIGAPAATTSSDIASALITGAPFHLHTRTGAYSLQRLEDQVEIGYVSFDHGWNHSWYAQLGELLVALTSLASQRAA